MKKIAIINGPNLNLLGVREPGIYGNSSFADYFEILKSKFPEVTFDYFQSNVEGDIVTKIQEIGFDYDGIVLNPAAYTHTSVAIRDAIAAVKTPVVEVHISNVAKREEFRHHSYVSAVCVGSIIGMGLNGYEYAVRHFLA